MDDDDPCSDTCTRNVCEWCPEADRQEALVQEFRRQLGLGTDGEAPQ